VSRRIVATHALGDVVSRRSKKGRGGVQSSHAEYDADNYALRLWHLQLPDRWKGEETKQEICNDVHPSAGIKVIKNMDALRVRDSIVPRCFYWYTREDDAEDGCDPENDNHDSNRVDAIS